MYHGLPSEFIQNPGSLWDTLNHLSLPLDCKSPWYPAWLQPRGHAAGAGVDLGLNIQNPTAVRREDVSQVNP